MVEIRNRWRDKNYLDLDDFEEIFAEFKEEVTSEINGLEEQLEKIEEELLEEKQAEIDNLQAKIEELESELNG